nr:hypothetical protein [Parasutterella excrementihominis]
MALGYAGAKMNAFTPSQTQALNKVVLNLLCRPHFLSLLLKQPARCFSKISR